MYLPPVENVETHCRKALSVRYELPTWGLKQFFFQSLFYFWWIYTATFSKYCKVLLGDWRDFSRQPTQRAQSSIKALRVALTYIKILALLPVSGRTPAIHRTTFRALIGQGGSSSCDIPWTNTFPSFFQHRSWVDNVGVDDRACRSDANEWTNEHSKSVQIVVNEATPRHFHLTFPICVRASRARAITLTDGRAARTTICRPHTLLAMLLRNVKNRGKTHVHSTQ